MIRLISGALRIIAFGVVALVFFFVNYPLETATVVGAFSLFAAYRLHMEREQLLTLDVRSMSPIGYERYCAEVLRRAGWHVRHVGRPGDQGVDVIAELRGIRAAIQVKRYSGRAGNAGVQQAVAGRALYGAQVAVLVAPFGFTRSAQECANANAALLLSHADLAGLERIARIP